MRGPRIKLKLPAAAAGRTASTLLLLLLLPLGLGCRSVGPATVARDRFDYSASISESWKRQTLLNIVKLRYLDPPIFVDVGQIVAGYQLQAAASLNGQLASAGAVQGNTLTMGGAATYIDRPTITYTPLTGNRFIRSLITPLPPESVFFTIQSGWPADGVMFMAVAVINGQKNQECSLARLTPPDPTFMRVLTLMREIQLSGAVALRVRMDSTNQQSTVLAFRSRNISPETLEQIHELRRLLGLDPNASEFKLVFGAAPANDKEVAVITRSLMQQMTTMASQVDAPAEDIRQGRASPGWETIASNTNAVRLITIHSSTSKPTDAFVEISYRGHWFWIDDRDLKSKRVFTFMMLLFTLADTGEKENPPLITIPAQ